MRITNNMLINNMVGYLAQNLAQVDKYHTMVATGKLIRKASEDPVVAARSLKLTTDVSILTQYRRNADSAAAWMTSTETAIKTTSDIMIKIRTMAVQASNGTLDDDDKRAISQQIKQLKDELINLANSTYSGRHIFSGYKSDTPLLDENGFLNVVISKLEKINYEVGVSNSIQVNVTGDSLFNISNEVSYLPARSALIQDIDDFLAMIDAKATLTSSTPLDIKGPGIFDMRGVSIDFTVVDGLTTNTINVNFDDANVDYINIMTSDQIIDYLNKRLGQDATASIDGNGNVIIRSNKGLSSTVSAADAAGAPGSVERLFGTATPVVPGNTYTGSMSITKPIVDVSAYSTFDIIVDRSANPITIDLSLSSPPSLINDLKNARLDEISAEINRQIAQTVTSNPTDYKWAKCTVEDGRLCLTSESFGPQSFIQLSGGQEIISLFGAQPTSKAGNFEQQGKLVGDRDFREPVVDITQFRDPPGTGSAPSISVLINGTFSATIRLDDGDPAIDPYNMTLRQIMKKIDDNLMGYATCDITNGKLVIRAKDGGVNSTIEMSSINPEFFEFLFGADPVIRNGANEPTHGFYRSGVSFRAPEDPGLSAGGDITISINTTTDSNYSITVNVASGLSMAQIVDSINAQMMADPAIAALVQAEETNRFVFATLVDRNGVQRYPPIDGQPPDTESELYLKIQSHTWGTGSNIKVEPGTAGNADDIDVMTKLFGYGTVNAPVIMGGVDGFMEEVCKWLDVADAQLANINNIWTDLGARINRVELTMERLDSDLVVTESLKSQNEDANEAYAMMMLSLSQTVYSASLAAGARVIQPTLLDFLR